MPGCGQRNESDGKILPGLRHRKNVSRGCGTIDENCGQAKLMRGHKIKKVWSKVTSAPRITPYSRLDGEKKEVVDPDVSEDSKREVKVEKKKVLKENAKKDEPKKEKPKRKGWKRFRHVALLTCRYIGMGVTHMSPVATYPVHDYHLDYNSWRQTYNSKGANNQVPHWTTGIILNGW